MSDNVCELCACEAAYNFHHLIPRTLHSNKWFKKRFNRDEMQAGLNVCKQCHNTVHELIDEKELGRSFNSRELLLEHPQVARYVTWKRRRK